jgi:hypothetical protein
MQNEKKYKVIWDEIETTIVKKSSNFIDLEQARELVNILKTDKRVPKHQRELPVCIVDQNYNEVE